MPRKKICFICLPNGLFRSLAPFESEEMEQEFSKSVHSISLAMCTNWCVSNSLYMTLGFTLHVVSCLNSNWRIWEGGILTVTVTLLAFISLMITTNRLLHCI
eukprot:EG_transcript_63348